MYHPVRRKTYWQCVVIAFIITICVKYSISDKITAKSVIDDDFDNNIIDFDSKYDTKYNSNNREQWRTNNFKKDAYRYNMNEESTNKTKTNDTETTTHDYLNVIPLDLITTTEDTITTADTTVDYELTVIPLSTTEKANTTSYTTLQPNTNNIDVTTVIDLTTTVQPQQDTTKIKLETETETVTTTEFTTVSKTTEDHEETTTDVIQHLTETTTRNLEINAYSKIQSINQTNTNNSRILWDLTKKTNRTRTPKRLNGDFNSTATSLQENKNATDNVTTRSTEPSKAVYTTLTTTTVIPLNKIQDSTNDTIYLNEELKNNATNRSDTDLKDEEVPIYTELDIEDVDVPEDYYDSKDVLPTKPPNTDALSVIFGLAGSVVESVAERVVPKGIFDLFKRMQKQNEALEAERLRSREENGGIGQFGRGILKSISSGLSRPLTQLMAGAKDIGSLDNDRGFVASLAGGVSNVANVANSVADAFKNRVQAIYPGTLWCGDGHSAQARSSDLGLFFFTDTCCRQHDACKIYIKAGETKYGLTNTGVFTRSHCSCDARFRECLRRTNSLVSSQIGLTYFNVLGPQCFRKAHPIVRCTRKTRLTGQKCEEYELDYTKPKMWQWFDNETF